MAQPINENYVPKRPPQPKPNPPKKQGLNYEC